MSASSHPEGLAIARQLIAHEAIERTGTLDLSKLGLVEPPEELLQLAHLQQLILGDWGFNERQTTLDIVVPTLEPNTIGIK